MLLKLGQIGIRSGVNNSFSPAYIANLSLWLDASDESTITHVSNKVSQWDDKSGNGNHATQPTGTSQFSTNINVINGRNVLSATNSDNMILPSGLYGVSNGNNTVLIVYRRASDGFSLNRLLSGGDTSGNVVYDTVIGDTGTSYSYKSNANWATESNQTILNDFNPHIAAGRRDGSSATGYFDGTAGAAGTGGNVTLTGLFINRSSQGNWDNTTGDFAEILIYDKALTDNEFNQVANYLATKWGITWMDI